MNEKICIFFLFVLQKKNIIDNGSCYIATTFLTQEEGLHENLLVRQFSPGHLVVVASLFQAFSYRWGAVFAFFTSHCSPLSERLEQAMWWRTFWSLSINHIPLNPIFSYFSSTFNICPSNFY